MKWIENLTEFIFVKDELKEADIIFLPGSTYGELAITGSELYHKRLAPFVLPSGKYAMEVSSCQIQGFSTEAEYFSHILEKNKVKKEAILQEREARYTWQNAQLSRKLTDEQGMKIKRAILCPQAYHARRCLQYYQIAYPDTEILVCPTITRDISPDNWYLDIEKMDLVLSEVQKCGSQFHDILKDMIEKGTIQDIQDDLL